MNVKNIRQLMTVFCIITLSIQIKSSFEHSTSEPFNVFGDSSYLFTWSIDETAATIKVDLDVLTTGWVGFGLSQDGQMSNSDVVMCYYSNNQAKAICQDSWSNSRSAPPSDVSIGGKDDLTDVTGNVTNGRTKISLKRKLKTGENKDLEIVQGKMMNVIFSYREKGNPDLENGQFLQHTRFSSKQIELYPSSQNVISPSPDEEDAYSMKLVYDDYVVPSEKTTYNCKYYDLNNLVKKQTNKANNITYHAIKFEPIVEHEELVHHMVLYGCSVNNVQLSSEYFECSRMPQGCNVLIWAWAPGVGTFNLPNEAGIVWGTYDTSKILLQIHYSNINAVTGVKDNSGVDVTYTTNLRSYDAGIMLIGRNQYEFDIPPGQSASVITGDCEVDCTNKLLGDIKVFAYVFHGHKLLRKIKTSFKKADGSDDITWAEDNYSFDHQRMYLLDNDITLKKGFTATTVCTFNTEGISTVTKGGESTDDEMCYNFLFYYPRENGIQRCLKYQGNGYCPMNDPVERVLSGFSNSANLLMLLFLIILF